MSIEIFNGAYTARNWADAHSDTLVETAVTEGAIDWELKKTAWGMVLEVAFPSEAHWERFRDSESVRTILGTVPDPLQGVLIYRGRSLDGGKSAGKKPKPKIGSGSNALSLPFAPLPFTEPLSAFFSDMRVDQRTLTFNR